MKEEGIRRLDLSRGTPRSMAIEEALKEYHMCQGGWLSTLHRISLEVQAGRYSTNRPKTRRLLTAASLAMRW
jgi:hypothetical protein